MTAQTATRQAIERAAAIFTEHPRDGWMCCFGSRHTDGPCRSCLQMWERNNTLRPDDA